jgi:outer membrane protein
MKKVVLFLLVFFCYQSPALAADLMNIYEHALENDPTFKKAYSTYQSSSEAIPIALAALRPQAGVSAAGARTYLNVSGVGDGIVSTYDSLNWQLKASQAIFNYQAWSQVKQAKASVKAAQALFNDAAQDLILRTAKAYFAVLFSGDTLSFAQAKKRANKRQLEQAQQRFNVGLDPITSVYEAKAAFDQSVAQVIAANNDLINQNENLRKLTNHVYEALAPLRDSQIPLIRPEPDNVNEWINTGLNQNYKLYAAKYSVQSSRDNIKTQAAANWPTVGIQGTSVQTTNNVTSSSFFLPDQQLTASVALAVNFPLFQGGLVLAKTKQAQYDFQSSSEDLEKVYRDVMVNSRIAFNTIVDGISKVKADRQTVISQENSLDSTEAQFEVGTRTMVDVTNAQRRLFEVQTQLAQDQYDLINATLTLKYLSGSLNVQDLEEIDAWLRTTRISSFPQANRPLSTGKKP